MRFEMSGKGGMRPNRGAGVRQEEPLRHEADGLCRVIMAGGAAGGVAVWLWLAEPRCGRGCRDEPVSAGVEMRRSEAVAAGGAAWLLRAEYVRIAGRALPKGGRSRVADGVAVWLWLAEPRCGREELRQSEANRLRDCGAVR